MANEATLDDLTPEQRERLLSFAQEYGPEWKDHLRGMWWSGTDANKKDGHLLRQIRNWFGPQWLEQVQLP